MICNLKISKTETGAILPLIAVMLVAIIGIVALLIDTSRGTYTSNTIQEVVDAASLSSVRQFNGKEDGWDNALSAALLAIKSNSISEIPAGRLDSLTLDIDGPWGKNTVGRVGDLSVTVARGIYWTEGVDSSFVSLEEGASYRPKGPWLHKDFSKKMFANAVKVEIALAKLNTTGFSKVQGVDSFNNLGKSAVAISDNQIDIPSFPAAISACQLMLNTDPHEMEDHQLTEYDPAKSLGREVYLTELEGFVTGADDDDNDLPTASQDRREGLRRYLSHISFPTYDIRGRNLCSNSSSGKGISCKHVPIQGLLGVTSNSPGDASINDLSTSFGNASNESNKVRIGQHFNPLREWPLGDVSSFTDVMKRYIESGSETINSRYIEVKHDKKFAKANFPAVRHMQINSNQDDFMNRPALYFGSLDRLTPNRINWPLSIADREFRFGLLVGLPYPENVLPNNRIYKGREPGAQLPSSGNTYAPFVNPMCNSADVNLDKTDYRIRRVNVMVIAPGTNDLTYNDGQQVSYCDFENQFKSQLQKSRVPWYKNEPRVIGVVPIDFIGFNFEDLQLRFANGTPSYTSSEIGGMTIADESPALLELAAQNRNEIEQYESEFSDCEHDPSSCNINALTTVSLPTEISRCFDDSSFVQFKADITVANNLANGYNISKNQCNAQINVCNGINNRCNNKQSQCDNTRNRCDNINNTQEPDSRQQCEQEHRACTIELTECRNEYSTCPNLIRDCMNRTREYNAALDGQLNHVKVVYNSNVFNIPAQRNVHCLPLPKEDAYDFGDSTNYEQPLAPLKAGRGCGGVRARVADEFGEPVSITTGRRRSEMTPIIVEDGQ